MKKTMVYISVYEKVDGGSVNKFYSIIHSPEASPEPDFIVNYGLNFGWFKSTTYPWQKLSDVKNARISHGYTLLSTELIDFNVYLEHLRKIKVLTELIENNITNRIKRRLAKYGRLTALDLREANSLYFKYKNT